MALQIKMYGDYKLNVWLLQTKMYGDYKLNV